MLNGTDKNKKLTNKKMTTDQMTVDEMLHQLTLLSQSGKGNEVLHVVTDERMGEVTQTRELKSVQLLTDHLGRSRVAAKMW